MRKTLITLCLSLSMSIVNAVTLTNLNSQQNGNSQLISFFFDTNAVSPFIMASGNDLIVDFNNVSGNNLQNQYTFTSGYVKRVNLATDGNRLRFIISDGALYNYHIRQNGNNVILSFNGQTPKSSVTQKSVGKIYAKNTYNLAVTTVTDTKFTRDDSGGGVVEITYSGDSQIRLKEQRLGDKLTVSLNEVSYAESIIKRLDVSDFSTPIKYIDIQKWNNNQLNLNILNRGSWDYAIYQLQHKLVINIRNNTASTGSTGIPNLKQDKSDRISLNFQNIDVRALLQLLADFSGYNILVSDSVSGTISLKLNNVPWDQALQIILNSKGLGMRRDGNVIRIAPVSELSALSKMQQDSQRAQEAVEPVDSLTIRLRYAQAASVQGMLMQNSTVSSVANNVSNPLSNNPNSLYSGLGGTVAVNTNNTNTPSGTDTLVSGSAASSNGMLSNRGSILVDTRTNTLIINDTPSRLKEIKDLIDKIDIPVKQVLIEARIVEANNTFERDLGTRLLVAGINGSVTVSNTLENAININQKGIGTIVNDPSGFINSNFKTASTSSMAAIYQPNSNTLIGLEIDALEAQYQGRTISSPKVITANYQPAMIQQGVQIPYQQASSAGNTNVSFVNATLALQVTPQITEDGNIMLNVDIQKNSPSSTLSVQGTPAIDTSSVNTQVLVQDGSTVLVGGIFIDDQSTATSQVPGLGDIPYLGWLFKSQIVKNQKKELLIFLTPRIVASNPNDIQ
ncbi:MAG: type IV pilus secretin PilQ [Proteobacteria bacterium]|nr:MAG: type IV pilus secretin PilQ [Pseudomonadota bacterium]